MTDKSREEEIKYTLEILHQTEIEVRRYTVAWCADKPERFGSDFFIAILLQEKDPICKWYAIRALGDLRADKYSENLIDVLRQDDIEVGLSSLHRICARSIGLLGPQMVSRIVELLNAPNAATQLSAVDTLGEIRHSSAIPALYRCFTSGEWNLQLWAALSLGKIGEASIPALVNAVSLATKKEIMLILDTLVMIGSSSVIDSIAAITKNYPDVVQFYFSGDQTKRAKSFLKLLHGVVSSEAEFKDQAIMILSFLRLKDAWFTFSQTNNAI